MTVAEGGVLLDRRRVELVEDGLPCMPHHHDAQGLPMPEAVALVERVRASAERRARACLDALAHDRSDLTIVGIALRALQPLPETLEARLTDYRARNVADWVMYRRALADAAEARGWAVSWYDAKHVLTGAAKALGLASIDEHLRATGRAMGPPWQKDHKVAMAAAIVAAAARR
jgi:hypothetical protein